MNTPTSSRIPQWTPSVGEEEAALVCETLLSNWIIEGPKSRQMEEMLCARLGARRAVLCTSGTAALFMALCACGAGPGDEVIIPDFTFVADANAVRMTGAKPVTVDVDERMTIDPARFEKAVNSRTKAVIAVHLNGRAADMERIVQTAKQMGIRVIEDAAQALGSTAAGRQLGTYGDIGCFSLATTKIITTGQGGFCVTEDDGLWGRLLEIKDQGRRERHWNYYPAPGFNFKFTDLQAAVGIVQMTKLEARLKRMRDIYALYRGELFGVPGIVFPGHRIEEGEAPWFIDILCKTRDELVSHLCASGIETRPFYPPLHTQPCCEAAGDFARSDEFSAQGLWLPCGIGITDEEIKRVCACVRGFTTERDTR